MTAADNFFWDDALALAGEARDRVVAELRASGVPTAGDFDPIDQAIAEAGWVNHRGPSHHRTVEPRRRGDGRFHWNIKDHAVSPHEVLASGRAFTRRGAWRQLNRAYGRLLDGAR